MSPCLRNFLFFVSLLLIAGGIAQWTKTGAQNGKENLDLPYDAGSAENDEESAPEIIVFYGQIYEGDAVVFCCDVSGSMTGRKWRRLVAEVQRNVQQFSPQVQFSVLFYSYKIQAFPAEIRLIEATPLARVEAMNFLTTARPGGATCTLEALVQAIQRVEKGTSKRKLVIHLSDGGNWCGKDASGEDPLTYDALILNAIARENETRIPINAICLGPPNGVRESFMRDLANQTGGRFSRVVD